MVPAKTGTHRCIQPVQPSASRQISRINCYPELIMPIFCDAWSRISANPEAVRACDSSPGANLPFPRVQLSHHLGILPASRISDAQCCCRTSALSKMRIHVGDAINDMISLVTKIDTHHSIFCIDNLRYQSASILLHIKCQAVFTSSRRTLPL